MRFRSVQKAASRVLLLCGLLLATFTNASGTATHTAPAAFAHISRLTYLQSNDSHLFSTVEMGWSGDGNIHANGVVRARSGAPSSWEKLDLIFARDLNSSAPSDEVYLYSEAASNYVTAEFAWGVNAAGQDQRGTLHARSRSNGLTDLGLWQTFHIVDRGDGSIGLYVYDSGGARWWVAAENGWSGDSHGVLRARTSFASPGAWEEFRISGNPSDSYGVRTPGGYVDGGNDYIWTYSPSANNMPPVFAPDGIHTGNVFGAFRQCVSYAAWKIYEMAGGTEYPNSGDSYNHGYAPSDWASYSIDVNGYWGKAGDWWGDAVTNGFNYTEGHTPHPGSMAWFSYNSYGGTGHVALVTAVQTNGSGAVIGFDLAQYNLGDSLGYSTAHFVVSNGAKVSSTDTTFGGAPGGLGHTGAWWIANEPYPDGFIDINNGY